MLLPCKMFMYCERINHLIKYEILVCLTYCDQEIKIINTESDANQC